MKSTIPPLIFIALLFLAGCIFNFRKIEVTEIDPSAPPVAVENPLKVFLKNGRVIIYRAGAEFVNNEIIGSGSVYENSTYLSMEERISLDSVEVMTSYDSSIQQPGSFLASLLGTSATVAGTALLAKAVFGSCPTIYSGEGEGAILESELFSNSIVKLFEHRDVDRLSIQPDAEGFLTLDVRNEALETHYINHLELLEVVHDEAAFVVPGPLNEAYVMQDLFAPQSATDAAGNNVLDVIKDDDQRAFQTDPEVLAAVDTSRIFDHIYFEIPRPSTDSVGIYLKLRTSLLTTVLFYDYMLASQGVNALNWITNDLNNISTVIEMSEWFRMRTGLRVEVWDGSAYQEVDRVLEVGPIAWKQVGVAIPIPDASEDRVKVRLTFIADAWRIDQVAFAESIHEGTFRVIPPMELMDTNGVEQPLEPILKPDGERLVTIAGQRYWIRFDAGVSSDEMERTYFLAGLGYYTEWIRGDWVREHGNGPTFKASDETLLAAMEKWRTVKDDFEARFESSKIPVR